MAGYDRDNVFSVTEVTQHLKHIIETSVPGVLVEGEIANFTRHRSGHIYFSLKDAGASLRCVFFKSYNVMLPFKPREGDSVVCAGKLSVYERSGSYQLTVTRMYSSGVGELQQRFEALKARLDAEGLFAATHKKPLPSFPRRVGVVTSATGAAIQDIRNVISRRYPCRIFLYSATVQGPDAANQVIRGIKFFNKQFPVDVLIIGRGGGSQEDLFCFNDETLARTIFASNIPIISAVGHEIDFTISDFVADLRAPTPSAAAELAVPNRDDILAQLAASQHTMKSYLAGHLHQKELYLQRLYTTLTGLHPRQKLRSYQQRLDEVTLRMEHATQRSLERTQNRLNRLQAELNGLSPLAAMQRGYAIARQLKTVIHSVTQLDASMPLEVNFSDGKALCDIREIDEKN